MRTKAGASERGKRSGNRLLWTWLLLLVLVLAMLVARIVHANVQFSTPPVEEYQVGEWAELKGAFTTDRDYELTDGYALSVNGAEILSPNEYLDRYARDGTRSVEKGDRPCLVVVDLTVRNVGNSSGHISAYNWRMISPSGDDSLTVASDLWGHVNKGMDTTAAFVVAEGTEVTTHVPFYAQRGSEYFQPFRMEYPDVLPGTYRLRFTNAPVKIEVPLNVS